MVELTFALYALLAGPQVNADIAGGSAGWAVPLAARGESGFGRNCSLNPKDLQALKRLSRHFCHGLLGESSKRISPTNAFGRLVK